MLLFMFMQIDEEKKQQQIFMSPLNYVELNLELKKKHTYRHTNYVYHQQISIYLRKFKNINLSSFAIFMAVRMERTICARIGEMYKHLLMTDIVGIPIATMYCF